MKFSTVGCFYSNCKSTFASSTLCRITLGILIAASTGCNREPSSKDAVAQLEKTLSAVGTHDALSMAIAAAKKDDFGVGVIALQQVKLTPGLTADQLMTVEQAAQALTADLVRRADAGDVQAKASLALIAQTRSQ